jgi:hypothetical protein
MTPKETLRIEYKYFVPEKNRSRVLNDLLYFMNVDCNENLPDRSYKVASIYFEDHALTSYHEKLEGKAFRKKIRLRFYPHLNTEGGNLEIKCKKFDKGFKLKMSLSKTIIENLLSGNIKECLEETENDSLERLLVELKSNGLKPFIRIDYRRVALYSKTDSNVRVTLDTDIRGSRVLKGPMIPPYIPVVPRGLEVLEIKSGNFFPYYLCDLVNKYSLKRSAISKYALAVQSIGLNSSMSRG